MYDEATVWHREGCVYGKRLLCDEGAGRDVSALGVWDDSDQEIYMLSQVLQGGCH